MVLRSRKRRPPRPVALTVDGRVRCVYIQNQTTATFTIYLKALIGQLEPDNRLRVHRKRRA